MQGKHILTLLLAAGAAGAAPASAYLGAHLPEQYQALFAALVALVGAMYHLYLPAPNKQ